MNLRIDPLAAQMVRRSIFISGVQRSGTTMMGWLVSSLEDVEYAEEPPMLSMLIPLINDLDQEVWQLMHDAYLFEEHLVPVLAGRRMNMNCFDDSYIGKVKSQEEIERRLARSYRHAELYEVGLKKQCAYKAPATLIYLGKMLEYMPELKPMIMLRDPAAVTRSFLGKEWYSDAHLNGVSGVYNGAPAHWLFKQGETRNMPYWLEEEELEYFLSLNEPSRACYAYVKQHEGITDEIADASLLVDYGRFLDEPRKSMEEIADRWNINFGPKTDELLEGVRPQKNHEAPWEDVPEELKKRANEIFEHWRAKVSS